MEWRRLLSTHSLDPNLLLHCPEGLGGVEQAHIFPRSGPSQSRKDRKSRGERVAAGSTFVLLPLLERFLMVEISTSRNEHLFVAKV